ncbi:hypothetical protein V2I01_20395 [Micromonospora sp. BRA006-A]|nr:hypothetical protein [Micromonospora sp. BRA006-A]
MGNLVTAWHNRTPLIVSAGQQTREMLLIEPRLASPRAVELAQPYVKWAHEPARAQDIPAAFMRAYASAVQPPPDRSSSPCRWTTGTVRPTRRRRCVPSPPGSRRTRTGCGASPARWPPPAPRHWCSARRWTGRTPGRTRWRWPNAWPPRSGPPRRRSAPGPGAPPALPGRAAVRDRAVVGGAARPRRGAGWWARRCSATTHTCPVTTCPVTRGCCTSPTTGRGGPRSGRGEPAR